MVEWLFRLVVRRFRFGWWFFRWVFRWWLERTLWWSTLEFPPLILPLFRLSSLLTLFSRLPPTLSSPPTLSFLVRLLVPLPPRSAQVPTLPQTLPSPFPLLSTQAPPLAHRPPSPSPLAPPLSTRQVSPPAERLFSQRSPLSRSPQGPIARSLHRRCSRRLGWWNVYEWPAAVSVQSWS